MTTKYRIVRDNYLGFEAQFKPWWSPFWFQCFGINTKPSLEASKKVVEYHKTRVVWKDKTR